MYGVATFLCVRDMNCSCHATATLTVRNEGKMAERK
jgi:hypothetical protein